MPEQKNPRSHRATGAKVRAAVVRSEAGDKLRLLEAALAHSGFWENLEVGCQATAVEPERFQVLIHPDLAVFDEGASTGTNPALVEHLIDLLAERGFARVAVTGSRDSFDLWLEGRDVVVLAALAGYRFVTERGHSYEVLDLGEDLVDAPFPPGSLLHGTGLARTWVNAGFRIRFAKNKTDDEDFYALCAAA